LCCSSSSTCANDTLFVETLLDELEETLCIDRRRIHATGISNGGMMAYQTGAKTYTTSLLCRFLVNRDRFIQTGSGQINYEGKLTKMRFYAGVDFSPRLASMVPVAGSALLGKKMNA
jgi:hypothetical protein